MVDYPLDADDGGDIGVTHDDAPVVMADTQQLEPATDSAGQDSLEEVDLQDIPEDDGADIGAIPSPKSTGPSVNGHGRIPSHSFEQHEIDGYQGHARRSSKRLSMNDQNLEAALSNLSTNNVHHGRTPNSSTPSLPAPQLPEEEEADDDSTPFESIALSATPPDPSIPSQSQAELPPLPLSPRPSSSKTRPSTSTPPPVAKALPTSPRLHAPPAIPHSRTLSASSSAFVPPPSSSSKASSSKPSAYEKVRSVTRQVHLPPKPKDEDEAHLRVWEEMMEQSKAAEQQRKVKMAQRQLEKEKRLALSTEAWDKLLKEDWTAAKTNPAIRQMWFEGVPGHLRGKVWALAIGNPLALSPNAYKAYLTRSSKARKNGSFPADTLAAIDAEMSETLPTLRLFGEGGPMRADLRELLCAWVVARSDEGLGYTPGISHIAAMLLINMPIAQAFLSLRNFLDRPVLRSFYCNVQDEIDAYYRVFENLQADLFPTIYANCKHVGAKIPESYFRSVLLEQLPFEACCRLWDQVLLDGDGYIFRTVLGIIGILEPRLYYPDKQEIISVLEGRNAATLAIVNRERERAKLRGEAFDEAVDGKLSVFGIDEHTLFSWLADDGWKESRYVRLLTREMPD